MQKSIKFRVAGRVQGVFFRASTLQQADSLQLTGWVRNCSNGDVEGVACGSAQQLDTFVNWLRQGPLMAQVEKLESEECDTQVFDRFAVR